MYKNIAYFDNIYHPKIGKAFLCYLVIEFFQFNLILPPMEAS